MLIYIVFIKIHIFKIVVYLCIIYKTTNNMNYTKILAELKNEIDLTLMFFVESDLKQFGFITKGTIECFETQKSTIPQPLKQFCHKELPSTPQKLKVQDILNNAVCCDQPYKHPLFKNLVYSDNVKYLCETAQSYWLLDIVGSILPILKKHSFIEITLDVYSLSNSERKALFTCTDGNETKIYQQLIEFTDFPIDSIKLFYDNQLLIINTEY